MQNNESENTNHDTAITNQKSDDANKDIISEKAKAANRRQKLESIACAALAVIFMLTGIGFAIYSKYKSDSAIVQFSTTVTTTTNSEASPEESDIDESESAESSSITTTVTTNTVATTTTSEMYISYPIDINKVTFDELIEIDGIGESFANKIIHFRESVGTITNMNMLLQIDGIGESRLSNLYSYLYVAAADFIETQPVTTTTVATVTTTQTTTTRTFVTTPKPTTTTTQTTEKPKMRMVNINTATAIEISSSLLIDIEFGYKIVELREAISYYEDKLELLYIDGMTYDLYNSISDYVTVK